MMHIITFPLIHHGAQLTNSHAHHIQTSHLHGPQTSPTHWKHPPIGRPYLSPTRLHRIRVHYVHAPQPLGHLLTGQLYVCTKHVAKGRRDLGAQEHHSVELPAPNLQSPLTSTGKKGIPVAKQPRLHAIGDQLHTRDLAPVDEGTLGALELQTTIVTVLVYRCILWKNRRFDTIPLGYLKAPKGLQPISIVPLRTPRYLRVVP